jgi:hypothetical protein
VGIQGKRQLQGRSLEAMEAKITADFWFCKEALIYTHLHPPTPNLSMLPSVADHLEAYDRAIIHIKSPKLLSKKVKHRAAVTPTSENGDSSSTVDDDDDAKNRE